MTLRRLAWLLWCLVWASLWLSLAAIEQFPLALLFMSGAATGFMTLPIGKGKVIRVR